LLLLSLDTATDVATACLWRDGRVVAEGMSRGRSTAAQRLLADVHHLLQSARVDHADLDAIVVGTGPGTFTGLRIGIATARALGFALGVPVHGAGTLDALLRGDGVEVACLDARRGEVFCLGGTLPLGAYPPAQVAATIAAGSVVVKPVPAQTTVAGVPARVVGEAGCAEPARAMDQMLHDVGL